MISAVLSELGDLTMLRTKISKIFHKQQLKNILLMLLQPILK